MLWKHFKLVTPRWAASSVRKATVKMRFSVENRNLSKFHFVWRNLKNKKTFKMNCLFCNKKMFFYTNVSSIENILLNFLIWYPYSIQIRIKSFYWQICQNEPAFRFDHHVLVRKAFSVHTLVTLKHIRLKRNGAKNETHIRTTSKWKMENGMEWTKPSAYAGKPP